MANLDRLYDALKQADAAGNKEDAQQLADYIRSELAAQPAEPQAALQPLVKPEDTSFGERALGSLKQGFQSFGEASEGRELARLKDQGKLPEAAAKMEAIKANAAKPQAPTLTPEDIRRIAKEKGYLPAGMELPSFVVEQILKSGPEMAESLLAGWAAGALTTAGVAMTPFAPAAPLAGAVVGTLAGMGTYAYQTYGHSMNTQALVKQAPEELDPANARKWAAITAPVGFAVDRLTVGVGKFGKKAVADAVVEELAKRTTGQVIKETVKAGAKEAGKRAAIGVSEMPTEMLEQWAELHQAGIPTDTEEAKQQIWDAGWSALAMGTGIGGTTGGASGAYNKYQELKSIDNTVNEVNEAKPAKERPSRETKINESWSKLEAKGEELRKQREAQTLAEEKAAAEAEAAAQAPVVAETTPIVAEEAPPVKRGRKAKVAAPEEMTVEEAPAVKPGVLDEATLTSLGLNKRSNAFKELLGVDASTPEGLAFLDETLDSHTGKINETAVGDFIQGLNIQETPDVNTQPPTVEPTADRAGVQALDERGPVVTEGAPQDSTGALGAAGDNVGQPAGGAEPSAAPLEDLQVGETTTVGGKVYRKTETGFELVEPEAPQSTEVIKEEEPVVVQEPLPIEKQGRALAKELRALDPDHPLIDDLTAFDVNEETLALAQQNIDELKAQRGAKGQTAQGELRELSEVPVAEDQDIDNFVDKVYGANEEVSERPVPELERVAPGITKLADETEAHKTFGETLSHMQDNYAEHLTEDQQILINKLKTINSVNTAGYQLKDPVLLRGVEGIYKGLNNKIEMRRDAVDPIVTLLHEGVHAATVHSVGKHLRIDDGGGEPFGESYSGKTEAGKLLVEVFEKAKEAAKKNTGMGVVTEKHNAFRNIREFIAEIYTNEKFQKFLASQPSVAKGKYASLWTDFVQAVKGMLGLEGVSDSMLSDAIAGSHEMFTEKPERGFGMNRTFAQPRQTQADDDLLRRTGTKPPRAPKPPTTLQRFATSPVQTSTEIMRKFRSYWASFDLAINKKIFDAMRKRGVDQKAIADAFYTLQVSQAVRTDAMADAFLERGDIKYDENIFKFVITKSNESMKAIRDRLDSLAKAKGINPEKIYAYASAAFIAKRSRGLKNANARLQRRVVQLVAQGKKAQAKKLYKRNYKLVNMTQSEIDAGLEFFNRYPEFNEIFDTWNDVREKVLDFAVEQGLLDADTRDLLLEVMDYVPFYLVEQLEAKAGPKEGAHGLIDTANTIQKMKGSTKEINDVFDNMERWIKYTIRKGIQNRAAQEKIKLYKQELPDDIKELPRQKRSDTGNTVSVWEDGKLKRYEFQGVDGETMVHGFTGLEPVIIPALSKYWISKIANLLRQSIVLQPVFSVIQIPQDAYNAWFSSGVKFPIMLPLQVAKEVLLTPIGLSRARRRLKQTVTVGKHDFSREYERMDLDAKEEAKKISTFAKLIKVILSPLSALSMASDNVIRQAVYSQLMLETGNEALAINAAEEIINFRRSGYGQVVNILRQTLPFVNANLEALHISLSTMTGDSINPFTRKQAMLRLLNAGGQAIAGTLIYVALMSDDDEYKKQDPSERGRFFTLPNGYKIPLRNDIFTAVFKVLPEELYNRYIDESEDSTKMRKALASAFKKALAIPGGMPTAVSGMVESYLNVDTVTGRPIVGQAQQGLAPELQVNPRRTPQIARLLGELGGVSPMQVDHLLSRYFSTMYGITAMLTNSIIADMRGEVLPKKEAKDLVLEFPFVSSIVTREFGARNIMDYYELQDVVNEAYKSYGNIKKTNTDAAVQAYLDQGNNRQLVLMEKTLKNISDKLASLRSYENKLLLDKTNRWNSEEKRAELDRIEKERQSTLGYQFELNERKDRYIQQLRYQGGL